MAESFARLLKRHRVAAGLSQERLAELAGVSADAISALERGAHRAPFKATLDLLTAALALDDGARREIEVAAKIARARGPYAQRYNNNLPQQLTSFVDREREVAEIKELLRSYRLVTVVGTGGAGKTRCTMRIARGMIEDYRDGVWLAELASVSDPVLVIGVIARTLGVREAPTSRPMIDTLLAYLKRKRLLLILDNCEHVLDEARRVAAAILLGCPSVSILATSRESFATAGEQVYQMPSLPVPSTSDVLSAAEMSEYGAVQLFSDRALSADNRFVLTSENMPHVADICRRLDGIPLAIELAAARLKVLSPHELARKLDERFRVLTAGDRNALPRHRTMRALIDWSYDLLSDDERRLFRALSIFAGDFTLELAAAVSADNDVDEIATLDILSSLVDKSLVQTEPSASARRYRLLESTREYAREKLAGAGEEYAVAREHARAFLTLAEQLRDTWETTPDRVWLARAERQLGNFAAALGWALGARGDVPLGQRLAGALDAVWRYFPLEGRRWIQAAEQRVAADTPASVLAALDLAEAQVALTFDQYKAALRAGERALPRYLELADPRGIAHAKLEIGRARICLGDIDDGERLTHEALTAVRALGAGRLVVSALLNLAFARHFVGDLSAARQHYTEALAVARAIGAERSAAVVAMNLAEAEFRDGNGHAAVRLAEEALPVLAFDDTHPVAATERSNLAAYLVALRRFEEARTAGQEALAAARDMQYSVGLAWTLQHLAAIGALRPDTEAEMEDRRRAARVLGYVDARTAALEVSREYTEQQEYDAMIPALSAALGENELAKLMAEGSLWSEDQTVAEAISI